MPAVTAPISSIDVDFAKPEVLECRGVADVGENGRYRALARNWPGLQALGSLFPRVVDCRADQSLHPAAAALVPAYEEAGQQPGGTGIHGLLRRCRQDPGIVLARSDLAPCDRRTIRIANQSGRRALFHLPSERQSVGIGYARFPLLTPLVPVLAPASGARAFGAKELFDIRPALWRERKHDVSAHRQHSPRGRRIIRPVLATFACAVVRCGAGCATRRHPSSTMPACTNWSWKS